MIQVHCEYTIIKDHLFLMESEKINSAELAERTKISRTTLDELLKKGTASNDVYEKIYSYAYEHNYRLNAAKEELLKEKK